MAKHNRFPYRLTSLVLVLGLLTATSPAVAQRGSAGTNANSAQPKRRDSSSRPLSFEGASEKIYKKIGDVELKAHIFNPPGHKASDSRPAIVFFFGGGWSSGSPRQFEPQCRYLASRGMVAITADYRVSSRHGVTAKSCVEDAKSAIRWVRANAAELGVDPERIVASGGSAGGHIAACTGVLQKFDAADEDAKVSSVPNAMVLFNPALVLAPTDGKLAFDEDRMAGLEARMGVKPEMLSPYHHVRKGIVPTLILHGEADTTVPFWTAEVFANAMKKAGNRCDLAGYEGMPHGFFNQRRFNETLDRTDRFLVSLGYLAGEPTIEPDGGR